MNYVIGENGILQRAKQGDEVYTKASIKEEIELAITDIEMGVLSQGEQLTKEKLVEELPNVLPGIIVGIEQGEIVGEYKDYEFTIDDDFNVIIKDKLKGEKPVIQAELLTSGIVIGQDVEIKVSAQVTGSEIKEILSLQGLSVKQEVSQKEKIYEASQNGIYRFIAIAENGRKSIVEIKVENIVKLEKDIEIQVDTTEPTTKVTVTVEWPIEETQGLTRQISLDGVNYTTYTGEQEVTSNGTVYARIINSSGTVICSSQKEIQNIMYQWEAWEINRTYGISIQQGGVNSANEPAIGTFYTSASVDGNGTIRYSGAVTITSVQSSSWYVGKYTGGYYIQSVSSVTASKKQMSCYLKRCYANVTSQTQSNRRVPSEDVSSTNKGDYPENGVKGNYWYVLKK